MAMNSIQGSSTAISIASLRQRAQSLTSSEYSNPKNDRRESYRRKVEGMVTLIEEGSVYKRGPAPLRRWQKRYLRFPYGSYNFSLQSLRAVHRKNVKKGGDSEEYERANRLLFEAMAAATVSAEDMLIYFKSKDIMELPQGLIYMKHVTGVEAMGKISRPNAFLVRTLVRDYVFSTKSAKDAELWVKSIQTRMRNKVPDLSNTKGYQISYRQLVDGKPITGGAGNEDEIFSASEMEFEPNEMGAFSSFVDRTIQPPPEDSIVDLKEPKRRSTFTGANPAELKETPFQPRKEKSFRAGKFQGGKILSKIFNRNHSSQAREMGFVGASRAFAPDVIAEEYLDDMDTAKVTIDSNISPNETPKRDDISDSPQQEPTLGLTPSPKSEVNVLSQEALGLEIIQEESGKPTSKESTPLQLERDIAEAPLEIPVPIQDEPEFAKEPELDIQREPILELEPTISLKHPSPEPELHEKATKVESETVTLNQEQEVAAESEPQPPESIEEPERAAIEEPQNDVEIQVDAEETHTSEQVLEDILSEPPNIEEEHSIEKGPAPEIDSIFEQKSSTESTHDLSQEVKPGSPKYTQEPEEVTHDIEEEKSMDETDEDTRPFLARLLTFRSQDLPRKIPAEIQDLPIDTDEEETFLSKLLKPPKEVDGESTFLSRILSMRHTSMAPQPPNSPNNLPNVPLSPAPEPEPSLDHSPGAESPVTTPLEKSLPGDSTLEGISIDDETPQAANLTTNVTPAGEPLEESTPINNLELLETKPDLKGVTSSNESVYADTEPKSQVASDSSSEYIIHDSPGRISTHQTYADSPKAVVPEVILEESETTSVKGPLGNDSSHASSGSSNENIINMYQPTLEDTLPKDATPELAEDELVNEILSGVNSHKDPTPDIVDLLVEEDTRELDATEEVQEPSFKVDLAIEETLVEEVTPPVIEEETYKLETIEEVQEPSSPKADSPIAASVAEETPESDPKQDIVSTSVITQAKALTKESTLVLTEAKALTKERTPIFVEEALVQEDISEGILINEIESAAKEATPLLELDAKLVKEDALVIQEDLVKEATPGVEDDSKLIKENEATANEHLAKEATPDKESDELAKEEEPVAEEALVKEVTSVMKVVEASSHESMKDEVIIAQLEETINKPSRLPLNTEPIPKAQVTYPPKGSPTSPGKRQSSFMTMLGEYAYSAVAPRAATVAVIEEEEIHPHYLKMAAYANYSGFLIKQSYLFHSNNLRYAILTNDGVLVYYRSSRTVSEGKPIRIDATTTVTPSEDSHLIITNASGVFHFMARNLAERDDWIKAIRAFSKP